MMEEEQLQERDAAIHGADEDAEGLEAAEAGKVKIPFLHPPMQQVDAQLRNGRFQDPLQSAVLLWGTCSGTLGYQEDNECHCAISRAKLACLQCW